MANAIELTTGWHRAGALAQVDNVDLLRWINLTSDSATAPETRLNSTYISTDPESPYLSNMETYHLAIQSAKLLLNDVETGNSIISSTYTKSATIQYWTSLVVDTSRGVAGWTNPTYAQTQNSQYATTSLNNVTSNYLKATGFPINVPTDATIVGVVASDRRKVSSGATTTETSVRLVKGGVISGDTKTASSPPTTTDSTMTYGSSSDMWGLTLTPADVNSGTFGFVVSFTNSAATAVTVSVDSMILTIHYTLPGTEYLTTRGSVGWSYNNSGGLVTRDDIVKAGFGLSIQDRLVLSEYGYSEIVDSTSTKLNANKYDFTMPKESVVDTIAFRLDTEVVRTYAGPGIEYFYANTYNLESAVAYTFTGDIGGTDYDIGYMRLANQPFQPVSQEKTYQYNVYDKTQFLTEWTDVASEPVVTNAVNSLPGEFEVTLLRDLESSKHEFEDIEITGYDADDLLLTNTQESVLASINVAGAVGDGSDINVNLNVDCKEYYGGYETLVTADGEELLTSDLDSFEIENGYPHGRSMFKGYISKYKVGYTAAGDSTSIKVLSHVDEHNNIIFESVDTVKTDNTLTIVGGTTMYPYQFKYESVAARFGQSFSHTSVTDLAALSVIIARNGYTEDDPSTYPTVNMTLIQGLPTDASPTVLGYSSATASSLELTELMFPFSGITLAANTTYSFIITATDTVTVAYNDNGYADGAKYTCLVSPWGNI